MNKSLFFLIFIILSAFFVNADISINIDGQADEWTYNTENSITATATCTDNNCTNIVLWPRYNKSSSSPDTDVFMDLLWKANATGTYDEFGSPTYHDGIVYTGSKKFNSSEDGWDKLFAFNASTGNQLWNKTYGQIDVAPYYKNGNLHFTTYDSFNHYYTVDASTGEQICNYTLNSEGSAGDLIIDELEIAYFCGLRDNSCYAVNITDCSEVWKKTIGNFGGISATSLSLYGDLLYFARYSLIGDGFVAFNKGTGIINWSVSAFNGYYWDTSPLIIPDKGIVFMAYTEPGFSSSEAAAYNLSTGSVVWSRDLNSSLATPSYLDGVIYGATRDSSSIYAINATNGNTLWLIPDSELGNSNYSIFSSPVISEFGFMVQPLTDLDQTLIIDTSDGTILRRINDAKSFSSPLIAGGYYVNNYDDWYIRTYDLSWGERTDTNWDLFKNSQYRNGTNPGSLKRYLGPKSCPDLNVGETCSRTWTFNASKEIYTDWLFDITAESSYNNGTDHNITSYSNDFSINITDLYDAHLQVYMPFDDDTSTVAYDLSKHDNNGVVTGATLTGDGYINGAFEFDGILTSFINTDSIVIGNGSSITTSCWVKPSAVTPQGGLIVTNNYFGSIISSKTFSLRVAYQFEGVTKNSYSLGGAINANEWSNIITVYDNTEDFMKIYANGVEVNYDSQDNVSGLLLDQQNFNKIGKREDIPYNGSIDEVMVFSTALTQSEITALYNNQSPRFASEGTQTLRFQNISAGSDKVNTTTDDFRFNNGTIETRLNYWTPSLGYNDTDPNLVASWHLDGNALDATGVNNGTVSGVNNITAVFDGGYYFDGINDNIIINNFNDSYSDSNVTVTAWFKKDIGSFRRILSTRSGGPSAAVDGIDIFFRDTGNIHLQVGSDGDNIDAIGSKNYEDGNFHFLTVIVEKGQPLRVFTDAQEIAYSTQETLTDIINKSYDNLEIGTVDGTSFYNGTLDEIKFYNGSLSTKEIKDLYIKGSLNYANTEYQDLNVNTETYDYNSLDGAVACYINSEVDSCGNNNGTLQGGASWLESDVTIREETLELDGSTEYVTLGTKINISTGNVGFGFWTKPEFVFGKNVLARGWSNLAINMHDNRFRISYTQENTTVNSIDTLPLYVFSANKGFGNWQHFYFDLNFTENKLYYYVDGVLIGSLTAPGNNIFPNTDPFCIGGYSPTCNVNLFPGVLDEVVILNRSLSATEIRDIYLGSKDAHATNTFYVPNETTIIQSEYKLTAEPNRFLSPTLRASQGFEYDITTLGSTPANPWFDIVFPVEYTTPYLILSLGFETNVTGINTTTTVNTSTIGSLNASATYKVAYNVLNQYDTYSYYYQLVKNQFGAQQLPIVYERNYSLMIQPLDTVIGSAIRVPVNLSEAMEAYSYEWTSTETPNLNSLLLTTGTIYGGLTSTNTPFLVDTYTG